jgi:Tfp pilus assembly protein PilF
MCRIDRRRLLPAFALVASVVCESLGVYAQGSGRNASGIPARRQTIASSRPQATAEELGDSLLIRRRYQQAIAEYGQVSRKSSDVWDKMGIAYELMFDVKGAMHCFKQSLRVDPDNAQAVNNLGTAYESMDEDRTAGRMYREALKLDPRSAIIARNLGTNLLMRHKYQEGLEAYRLALKLDPHIFDGHSASTIQDPTSLQGRGAVNYFKAKSCAQAGQMRSAVAYLRMAIMEGFTSIGKVTEDHGFAALRGTSDFQRLVAESKEQ